MTDHQNNSDAYDSPWKDVLEHAFPEFMAFYFPAAYAQIDWAQGHEFKHTELRQVVRDAELGKRFADALVQVTLEGGEPRWIYIHIEVQGQRDSDFARRMFAYNYRLFDRYASLAVLADEDKAWRPDYYGFEVLGCHHTLEFPIVKLIDYADRAESLAANPNPFALVTVAHLRTRQTKNDPQARYRAKLGLVRLLYRQGWDKQRIQVPRLTLFSALSESEKWPDARRASAGIASPISSSRNNADGRFSPRPEGAPKTRPSVTALGKRSRYSLRAVPCLGAFGGALRVKNKVRRGTNLFAVIDWMMRLPNALEQQLWQAYSNRGRRNQNALRYQR